MDVGVRERQPRGATRGGGSGASEGGKGQAPGPGEAAARVAAGAAAGEGAEDPLPGHVHDACRSTRRKQKKGDQKRKAGPKNEETKIALGPGTIIAGLSTRNNVEWKQISFSGQF